MTMRTAAAITALWMLGTGNALTLWAQEFYQPMPFRLPPSTVEPPLADPPAEDESPKPLPRLDPNVRPASADIPRGTIRFPPTPRVSIRVYAPAVSPNGQELSYRFVVTNDTRASANRVVVRATLPPHTSFVKADPEPSETTEKELRWELGTLTADTQRTIRVTLAPKAEAAEVRMCARVAFEHGQCVITQLARPAATLKKEMPEEAILFDPLICRLIVTNPGKVPATDVRLVEKLDEGLQFEEVLRPNAPNSPTLNQPPYTTNDAGNERTWVIGTLPAGQRRIIEYRVLPKTPGKHVTETKLTASDVSQEKKTEFMVKKPELRIEVKGPSQSYVDQPTEYQINVNNIGDAVLHNVRVSATLPSGSRAVKISSQGQVFQQDVQWIIKEMKPKDSTKLTLSIQANRPGERSVLVAVRADRGLEQRSEVKTEFLGVAALNWDVTGDPATATVGERIRYTIEVRNTGTAPARNVVVRATLPESVKYLESGPVDPQPIIAEGSVEFPARTIDAGAKAVFTLQVQATRADQARFLFELLADHLDKDRPVRREPSTTIQGE